jgi:hypothetical protein
VSAVASLASNPVLQGLPCVVQNDDPRQLCAGDGCGWRIRGAHGFVASLDAISLRFYHVVVKYLPLIITRGPLLAAMIRDAYQDPRRRSLCGCCGARMLIKPDLPEQMVRCPACSRLQRVAPPDEVPWRLTASSAEALRRTRSWLRRL